MPENWSAVAAEVADAIGEVGFTATLRRRGAPSGLEHAPTFGPDTDYPVTVIDDLIKIRKGDGTLTGETMRVLTVGATGVVPFKDDRVQVRGVWLQVVRVMPLAPGGVDLLFDMEVQG